MRIDLPGLDVDVDPDAWVAPTAVLVGAVRLAARASVWYGAVLRADGDQISIGAGSNLQDLVIAHADPDRPVRVGAGVSVGHRAVLHGCTIGDGALIGMGAIVLNNAVIGDECLIGAGALITEGMEIAPRQLVLGSPARARRSLTEDELAKLRANALTYVDLAARHADALAARADGH